MKLTLDAAKTIVIRNLEEARERAKYDHRTSEYWPTLIGERLWFLNMLNNIEVEPQHTYVIVDEDGNMECSNCGSSNCFDNYCGTCGAKLIGTRKEDESVFWCKDCKHNGTWSCPVNEQAGKIMQMDDKDYCSWGVGKDSEEND